jgi:hypothetical protein
MLVGQACQTRLLTQRKVWEPPHQLLPCHLHHCRKAEVAETLVLVPGLPVSMCHQTFICQQLHNEEIQPVGGPLHSHEQFSSLLPNC